jgi:diguanylate cyclase (GGDEF)-like protein
VLDFITLYIVIVLMSFALAAIWGTILYSYRDFRPACVWLSACLCTGVGGLVLPFQHWSESVLPAAIGNGLVILGFWGFWIGARRFHALSGGWKLASAATTLCVTLTVLLFGNNEAIALVYAIGQSVPMTLSLVLLLGGGRRSVGSILSSAGLGIGLAGHAVVIGMNIWLMWRTGPFVDLSGIGAATMLCVILSGILWHFGLAVMTIDRLRAEVADLARVDALTGAWNRRKLDEILASERTRSLRTGKPCALLLLDLDRFKSINDTLGHAGGDRSLMHFVEVIRGSIRASDFLARLGGDEFCILMPETTAEEAGVLAERIARGLRSMPLVYLDREVKLSCSIGISALDGHESFDEVVARADKALYAVKRKGRDGFAVAQAGQAEALQIAV